MSGSTGDGSGDVTTASLLTPAEEQSLAATIEAGVLARESLDRADYRAWATEAELEALEQAGECARLRFTEANLGLVRMVSRQLALRSGVAEADVFQEACLGLLLAVRRFDCRRGFRFATYALFWIRAFAGSATARMLGDLNLPTSRAAQLRSVRGVEAELTQTLGRPATAQDIAAAVGRPERWIADLLAHLPPRSLNALEPDLVDIASLPVRSADGRSDGHEAMDLLGRLGGQSRQVLEMRLGFTTGEPLSYAAVARALELPVNRVRRVEAAALEELRDICPYDLAEGW